MRSGLAIACLASIAGCTSGDGVESAPRPLAVPTVFHATGTEPFWGISVTRNAARYSTPEIPEATASDVVRRRDAGVETVSGRFGKVRFRLTVRAERCSDGMSDRVYPFAAHLRLGDRDLEGCAAGE